MIALVITIIVLLILVGVTLSTLSGQDGILNKAANAAEETEKATEDEQRKMATFEAAMNTELTYFQGVPIPAGFAPTRIEGESTVDEGLVIIDSKGNEFVWIPCEYDSASVGTATDPVYYNGNEDEKKDNRDEGWKNCQEFYNGGIWYDSQPHTIGQESIKKHHGFYVARYEAGVPETADFYVNPKSTKLTYSQEKGKNTSGEENKISTLAPVSKKGYQAWNFISQTNAKTVAGNIVDNSDVKSYLIDSHAWNTICRLLAKKETSKSLTDSTNWGNYSDNTTTKYEKLKGLWADLDNGSGSFQQATEYKIGNIPKKTSKRYIELATGICEDFKAYNIYDLAGNMWEWTTETGDNKGAQTGEGPSCYECKCGLLETHNCADSNCSCKTGVTEECTCKITIAAPHAVYRGGSFDRGGSGSPVIVSSGISKASASLIAVGFRVVLYLK